MNMRRYYEAYDDRYRQVHGQALKWFHDEPSAIVGEVMRELAVTPRHRLLELGCGEGRDAFPLLEQGYDLLATDVSPEAIAYCQRRMPERAGHFRVLDCVAGELEGRFDFIYAVAVVHMLVEDGDRDAFYGFIRGHLRAGGAALICTMGDGSLERSTDPSIAFDVRERVHEQTGRTVRIASTSCRMVSFDTFARELRRNGLSVVRQGLTAVEPDFPQMMYALVRAGQDVAHC